MLDLAFGDQVPDSAGDILHWHVGIDAMLVEQVDAIGAQALQRGVRRQADSFRTAVHALRGIAVRKTKLGGKHYTVSNGCQGLAHKLLVRALAVSFCSVEEGHAALERVADQSDAICLGYRGPVAVAQAHAAQADGGDFELAVAECAGLHLRSPLRSCS